MTVTKQTRLRALREALRDTRVTDGQVNPRLVESIQQSLAAEGYVYSDQAVREIGEGLAR